MAKRRYLILNRSEPKKPGSGGGAMPSPEQMQKMMAVYKAWMEKFKDDIVDMGDKLKPEGRLLTASGLADGPFVELKEVIGGYMILTAESY